jgi:hypothetical protein
LVLVATPDSASTGFDCYFDDRNATVRPTDGRLIYTNTFEDMIREYSCDACVYSGIYPTQVLSNDAILPVTCANGRVTGFKVTADGLLIHTCDPAANSWRDATGTVIYDGTSDRLIAVGAGGWLLTQTRVLNPATADEHVIAGLPATSWLAARWSPPDAFFIALGTGSGATTQLWRIGTTGVAQMVGTFPPFANGYSVVTGARLDRAGRLFQFARETAQPLTDAIVRSQVGGRSEAIYTEASNPLVKVTPFSALVTGP